MVQFSEVRNKFAHYKLASIVTHEGILTGRLDVKTGRRSILFNDGYNVAYADPKRFGKLYQQVFQAL
jgi:hypothetical protein